MDKVSRPLLGLLLATVGLAGVWMVALRPHTTNSPVSTPAPAATAPGTAGLGRAVQHAKDAVTASNKSAARTQSAAADAANGTETASKPSTTASKPATDTAATGGTATPVKPVTAKPVATAPATPSAWVLTKLAQNNAVVLLFTGDGADDRVARDVVKAVHGPHVVTRIASIADLAQYDAVTGGLDISGAPTILVIGPDKQASEIVGLPDLRQVQSALRTALPRG
jgi:hypothetical protein